MLVFTGLVNIGYIVATCICNENPIWSKTFSVIVDKTKKILPRPNMSDPGPGENPTLVDLNMHYIINNN